MGIRMQNNAGIVTTTGGGAADLVHTLSLGRHLYIRKIMAYNNTGANVTLQFGTLNRAAAPAFLAWFPLLVAIDTFDNEWLETELPLVKFLSWPQATAAGRTGDVYVVGSAAGVTLIAEVEESQTHK